MNIKDGDILVHKRSGTFAEVTETPQGYSLGFTMRFGGKVNISNTQSYSIFEIAKQWRHIETNEIHMFNKGKLSICG